MNAHDIHTARGARARILIVEDNRAIANALKLVLQYEGYDTRWCDDESVYAIVKEWRPAVILMDLKMPNLDGRMATRTLKEDPSTRDIPIIVVTAENIGASHAGEMNANDLLMKPFPVRRLLERVGSWVSSPLAAAATSAVASALRSAQPMVRPGSEGAAEDPRRATIAGQDSVWNNGAAAV
jgi:CheY-like chemotaxis protein